MTPVITLSCEQWRTSTDFRPIFFIIKTDRQRDRPSDRKETLLALAHGWSQV